MEYIAGAIAEEIETVGQGPDEMYEVVGELLVGYEVVDSEEAALEMCKTILSTLQAAGLLPEGGAEADAGGDTAVKLLSAPVVMAKQPKVVDATLESAMNRKRELTNETITHDAAKTTAGEKDKAKASLARSLRRGPRGRVFVACPHCRTKPATSLPSCPLRLSPAPRARAHSGAGARVHDSLLLPPPPLTRHIPVRLRCPC